MKSNLTIRVKRDNEKTTISIANSGLCIFIDFEEFIKGSRIFADNIFNLGRMLIELDEDHVSKIYNNINHLEKVFNLFKGDFNMELTYSLDDQTLSFTEMKCTDIHMDLKSLVDLLK